MDENYFYPAVGTIMLVTILFMIPLSLLVTVQITNYLKGITTNERFGRGNPRSDSDSSIDEQFNQELSGYNLKTQESNNLLSAMSSDYTSEIRRPSFRRS